MLSRRDVLNTTVAAGAGLAMASQISEPAKAQPARRIIVDAQAHIWKMHTPERPWPADGIGQAHIPRPFSHYELLARMDEAGVDRLVIVPPSWEALSGRLEDDAGAVLASLDDSFLFVAPYSEPVDGWFSKAMGGGFPSLGHGWHGWPGVATSWHLCSHSTLSCAATGGTGGAP